MNWKRLLCRLTQHTPYDPGDWREMVELGDKTVRRNCQTCGCLLKRVILKSWEKVEAGTGEVTTVEKIRWVALSREEQVAEALMEEDVKKPDGSEGLVGTTGAPNSARVRARVVEDVRRVWLGVNRGARS